MYVDTYKQIVTNIIKLIIKQSSVKKRIFSSQLKTSSYI